MSAVYIVVVNKAEQAWRPSLALKVGVAMGTLLVLVIVSLHHMYKELQLSSTLVHHQRGQLTQQSALVDKQVSLLGAQTPLLAEQARALQAQQAAVGDQLRLLGEQRESMAAQSDALGSHWTVVEIVRLFSDLRYWISDYALSGRTQSIERAAAIEQTLRQRLELLAHFGTASESVLGATRTSFDNYMQHMHRIVLATRDNDRASTRELIARSREVAATVKALLDKILIQSDQAVVAAAEKTLTATQRIGTNADAISAATAQLVMIGERVQAMGAQARHAAQQVKHEAREVSATGLAIEENHTRMQSKAVLLMVTAVVVGSLIALLIVRVVVVPIRRLAALMDDVTSGELTLTHRVTPAGADELVRARSFNRLLEKLSAYLAKPFTFAQPAATMTEALTAQNARASKNGSVTSAATQTPQPVRDPVVMDALASSAAAHCSQENVTESVAELDASVLAQIHALDTQDDSGFLQRLVTGYAQSSREDVNELRLALARADADALRQIAHHLKSSSGTVGAVRLASLCQTLELNAREGRIADAETMLEYIETERGRVERALCREIREVA